MLPDIFMLWLAISVSLPNFILFFTEPAPFSVRLANLTLLPALWWAGAFWLRRPGRAIWYYFPLIFFGAFEIVLLWLYGQDVIAVDMFLNLLTTNPNEAGELLGNLWPSLIVIVIIYVPLLVAGSVYFNCRPPEHSPLRSRTSRVYAPAAVFATGLVSLLCSPTPYGYGAVILGDIYPINVVYNAGLAVHRISEIRNYVETSRGFRFEAVSTRPDSLQETYIIVLGETARADRWQLLNPGDTLSTNPLLSRRLKAKADSAGTMVAFPRAISQSTTTHKAVPLMLTHLSARNYADSLVRVKSIITAFREAGFHTTFISNQRPNKSFIEKFTAEADTLIYTPDVPTNDLVLPPMVENILKNDNHPGKKRVIILHTYGSHFSYRDRYQGVDIKPHLRPDDYTKATAKERPILMNAYDNSIILVDSMLSKLITIITPLPGYTGLLYAGDHGEEIFDAEGLFLHATPFPTINQLHVPFMIWLSPALQKSYFKSVSTGLDGRLLPSSEAFFHTALHMAGVTTPKFDIRLSALNSDPEEPEIFFLNDHNLAYPLKNYGIKY